MEMLPEVWVGLHDVVAAQKVGELFGEFVNAEFGELGCLLLAELVDGGVERGDEIGEGVFVVREVGPQVVPFGVDALEHFSGAGEGLRFVEGIEAPVDLAAERLGHTKHDEDAGPIAEADTVDAVRDFLTSLVPSCLTRSM